MPAGYPSAQAAADAGARASGQVNDPRAIPGQQVATGRATAVFRYQASPAVGGPHVPLFEYVYEQGGQWYPYTWVATLAANVPMSDPATIQLDTGGGCVNLRAAPSMTASVLQCVPAAQWVVSASPSGSWGQPPVWTDANFWWYVAVTEAPGTPGSGNPGQPQGWMSLQYLVCDAPHAANACG